MKYNKSEGKKAIIELSETLCKGCGICIEFCPAKGIKLSENLKVSIKDADLCNACGMCELRCPDFAIRIIRKEAEKKKEEKK